MRIMLMEKVAHLGNLGDLVKVRDGYARNFLIPTGRAKRATPAALQEFETKRGRDQREAGLHHEPGGGYGEGGERAVTTNYELRTTN